MLSWHSQIRFSLQGARVALHLTGPRSHVGHKEYNERYVRHTNSPQRHALPRESKHHRIRIKKKKEIKRKFQFNRQAQYSKRPSVEMLCTRGTVWHYTSPHIHYSDAEPTDVLWDVLFRLAPSRFSFSLPRFLR